MLMSRALFSGRMVEGVYLANWEVHNPKQPFLSPGAHRHLVHETQLGLFHGFKLFWALGVFINGGYPKWIVYNGKSYKNGMIWGYPHFRKPPYVKVFPPIFGYWCGFTTNS